MPLDPFLANKLNLLEGVSLEKLEDPEILGRWLEFHEDPVAWTAPDVAVEDRSIEGPHGAIPIRVYTPRTAPAAAVLWLHGGGFLYGDLEMPESHVVASELSARADAVVVSVGYRLAVDGVRYPVPLDDVHTAWRWFVEYYGAGELVLGLGGASAGAALALGAAMRERDAEARQADMLLLAYPFAHFPNPAVDDTLHAALSELPPLMRFSVSDLEFMVKNYVGRISDIPLEAIPGMGNLCGLPTTRIIVSEYDHLRASGEMLIRQLQESGVDVNSYLAVGMPHGHLNRTPALEEVDHSLTFFAQMLKTHSGT